MSDIYSSMKRSSIMKAVKSKNNKSTELKLLEFFKKNGVKGWRRQYNVKGHPDFVFLKDRIAIFVDGCFWHGHDCRKIQPEQNKEFWIAKQQRNMKRDAETTALFQSRGWTVIRIWECELKKKNSALLYNKLKPVLKRPIDNESNVDLSK